MTEIRLAPMDDAALLRFENALLTESGTGEFQWFGFTDLSRVRARYAEGGLLGDQGGMLSVVVDGELAGRVEWLSASWGRSSSACWTIAVGINEGQRRRGIGTAAHRLLVDYLFRHSRAERVQAYTDKQNIAERSALSSAGFIEEGVVRRAQWRNGSWHDMVLSSSLREEWGHIGRSDGGAG